MNWDGWERIGQIGSGGQGTVYRVRSPERVKNLIPIAAEIARVIAQTVGPEKDFVSWARKVVELGGPDPIQHLGALKVFSIPSDDTLEEQKAIERLRSEVEALEKINHPAVLKLLHKNLSERFIVTEFHPRGMLKRNLHL